MSVQDLINQGFGGYAGWSDAEADANFAATGGAGKYTGGSGGGGGGGVTSVDDYIAAITDLLPKPKTPYSEINPFEFDEAAAKELATAEFSPYYDELLSDYMTDVETTKSRIGEDKQTFLSELNAQKDSFLEKSGTQLDRAIRGIREGYSGKGLYFSGERQRTEAETEADNQRNIQDYMRSYDSQASDLQTTAQRNLEDITNQVDRYQRDLGREKDTAITKQVQQLRGEALDEYQLGMSKYYSTPDYTNY